MIRIKASEVINFIVEKMFPRGQGESKGFYLVLNADLENFDTKKKLKKKVHFVFQRSYNYTKVFVSFDNSSRPAPETFVFKCDHDSCWRDSVNSVIAGVYFDMADKLGDIPIRLIDNSDLETLFSPVIVTIKVEPDTTDSRGYNKKLTFIGW